MADPAIPFGISPADFDKLLAKHRANLAKKDFAVNRAGNPDNYPPVPKWDQVIKIDPRLPSPREYLAFVGADLGLIDIESLSPATQKSVLARLAVANKVRSENMPEWRQKMVTLMTALDNAEDIISTLAWLFGPYIEKTGRVGRGIVKGSKLSADGINFINKFLRGPELTRKAKHRYMDERKMNARTRTMRNVPRSKGGKWLRDNLGNLIQAAQASESITGVGLQIGVIYGTLENAFWDDSTTLLTVGELFADRELSRLGFFRPGAQQIVAKRIAENEAKLAKQPVPWIKQMADWINANSTNNVYNRGLNKKIQDLAKIIGDNPFFDIETHALAITAFNLFADMAGTSLRPHLDNMDHERFAKVYDEPPASWNHISRCIMRAYGIEFNKDYQAIGKARHRPQFVLDVARQAGADFLRNNGAWLPNDTATDTNVFLHSQVLSAASITGGILSTTGDPVGIESTLDEQMVIFALDQAACPPQDATIDEIAAWAKHMKARAGPDIERWRRGGFYELNMAYWRALGRQPAFFNN